MYDVPVGVGPAPRVDEALRIGNMLDSGGSSICKIHVNNDGHGMVSRERSPPSAMSIEHG
jgi:hypothetical protein